MKDKITLRVRIPLIIFGILLIGVMLYYYLADGVGKIEELEGYQVVLDETVSQENLPEVVVKEYLKQYQKWYLTRKQRIHNVSIQEVTPLQEEMISTDFLQQDQIEGMDASNIFYHTDKTSSIQCVQIDFTVDTVAKSNETLAMNVDGIIEEDNKKEMQVQWVLYYETKEINNEDDTKSQAVIIWRKIRPAAYDLMKYNESGQAEADRIQAEKEQQEAQMTRDPDGKAIGQLDGTIFWVNSQVGYDARQEDKAMSQEYRCIYCTKDGGVTWEEVGPAPSDWILQSYAFLTEDLGFFTYPKIEGESTNLYRTQDGGKTFEPVGVPVITVTENGFTYQPFTMPVKPWEEDGVLYMYLEQGSDGDYQGGKVRAIIKSEDQGKTWVDTGKIDLGETAVG